MIRNAPVCVPCKKRKTACQLHLKKILRWTKKSKKNQSEEKKKPTIYGDPEYDASEDIYSKGKKIGDIEEEIVPGKIKSPADGLDIPGSELDDADEAVGEEDEENNFYSLGGDDHNDLEENKDE